MISNAAAKHLWDAQQAVDRITRFTSARTFEDYLADDMLAAAVERQFAIIGEAFMRLRRLAPEVAAMIRELGRIIGFRNVVVHAYDTIDAAQVWGTIQNDLPLLQNTVARLLRDVAPPRQRGSNEHD